eukprot:7039962-Pyramimonas_sp.AAC.1
MIFTCVEEAWTLYATTAEVTDDLILATSNGRVMKNTLDDRFPEGLPVRPDPDDDDARVVAFVASSSRRR